MRKVKRNVKIVERGAENILSISVFLQVRRASEEDEGEMEKPVCMYVRLAPRVCFFKSRKIDRAVIRLKQ